jgi:hypothetical protein
MAGFKRFAFMITFTLGLFGAADAQQIDEMQARAACQDDAFRLCQAAIPDRERTLACLVQSKDSLSGACRTVLAEFFPPEPTNRKRAGTSPSRAKRGPVDISPSASR